MERSKVKYGEAEPLKWRLTTGEQYKTTFLEVGSAKAGDFPFGEDARIATPISSRIPCCFTLMPPISKEASKLAAFLT